MCMSARQSALPVCAMAREKETVERERESGSLSPRKSVKNSPSLCPLKRFMNPSIGCACVRALVCARTDTTVPIGLYEHV